MKQYADMYELFKDDATAKQYFDGLPVKIREQVNTQANRMNSYQNLKGYAEDLLRGDA